MGAAHWTLSTEAQTMRDTDASCTSVPLTRKERRAPEGAAYRRRMREDRCHSAQAEYALKPALRAPDIPTRSRQPILDYEPADSAQYAGAVTAAHLHTIAACVEVPVERVGG